MLETLHRIVKEVNDAPDLEKALSTIVTMVKQSIGCDVCSVYLTDADSARPVLQEACHTSWTLHLPLSAEVVKTDATSSPSVTADVSAFNEIESEPKDQA